MIYRCIGWRSLPRPSLQNHHPSHLLSLFWEHFQQIYECNAKEISHSLTHYPAMEPDKNPYHAQLNITLQIVYVLLTSSLLDELVSRKFRQIPLLYNKHKQQIELLRYMQQPCTIFGELHSCALFTADYYSYICYGANK